jgi:hypothetical protein
VSLEELLLHLFIAFGTVYLLNERAAFAIHENLLFSNNTGSCTRF